MTRAIVVRTVCAALLALVATADAFADSRRQDQRAAPSGSDFLLAPKPPRSPYSKLFVQPAPTGRTPARAASDGPAGPRVVCGTRLIPVDPLVDSRIYAPRRSDDTAHTIRAVPPPMCR
jgi:hypothetical protein